MATETDPAVYRVGSLHEEDVHDGEATCAACGPVDVSNPQVDRYWHADTFAIEEEAIRSLRDRAILGPSAETDYANPRADDFDPKAAQEAGF